MPVEPYTNPDRKPFSGPLKWVPDYANGNDVGFGYKATVIKRGRFSNDYINSSGATIGITTIGTIKNSLPEWPIQASFRPLQNPDQATFIPPTSPLVLSANTDGSLEYRVMFQTPSGQSEPRRASAITIDYNLIIDPADETILSHLYSDDKSLIESGNASSINWSKYPWGVIETINGTTYTEWPEVSAIGIGSTSISIQELKVTGTNKDATTFKNLTIRFGEHNFGSDYPLLNGIRFRNRYSIPSLQLQLNKLMIFEVEPGTQKDRVNIDYDQVPCSHLQYCFLVNFEYNPLTEGAIYPRGSGANFHVKAFVPENKYYNGISGFAHSTELRFLMFSIPAFGISPFDTTLAGLLSDLSNPSAYYTVFVGPIAGKRSVRLFCSNDVISSANARIIRLDYTPIQEGTLTVNLQHATNYSSVTAPDPNNVSWEDIFTLNLNNMPNANPTAEEGYVASYTYAAKESNPNQWYRTIQSNTNNSPIVGIPTYSELWSDKTILSLYESTSQSSKTGSFTITKRVNHISKQPIESTDFSNIQPFALFVVPSNIAISHPISVNKGFWNLTYSASCTDSTYTNTHVFARMWFVPNIQSSIISADKNGNYKKQTEITFNYDDTQPQGQKTQVIMGKTPDNNWTQEVIVSPPLGTDETSLYLRRYADIAKQGNKTVTEFDFPYTDNTQGCMTLAFYQVTYITDEGKTQLAAENKTLTDNSPNLPLVNITFDGSTDGIETMLRQTQSQQFLYERANNYIESYYTDLNTLPLTANRYQYGIGTLPPVTTSEPENLYSITYPVNNNSSHFYGLLTLQETSGTPIDLDIVIPYTKIAESKENSSSFSADFITSLQSMGLGLVGTGSWQIDTLIDINSTQASKVNSEYRIEVFLANENGEVTERIYTSDWTNETAKSFVFTLGLEFPISSGNIQLALRLTSRAWSKDGTSIDVQVLQDEMNVGGVTHHLGTWIKKISIVQNTIQRSKVIQNVYAGGSPAYYEDLPLIPGPDLAGNDGYYVAAKENLNIAITFPDKPWPVSGCFYSPAWKHYLPQNVEVDFRTDLRLNDAASAATKYLRFRTVPTTTDGTTTEFLAIGADTETTSTRTQIVKPGVDILDSDNSVKYYTQSSASSINDIQISKEIENSGSKVYMSYPDVIIKNNNGSTQIIVIGNKLGQTNNDLTVKTVGSDNAGWMFKNQGMNNSNLLDPSSVSKSLLFTKASNSSYGNRIYVSGWISPGVVAIKSADLQYSSADLDPLGAYWIVDGDSANLVLESRKYTPMGDINGVCVQDFPAFTICSGGEIIVAYSLENRPGELVARTASESARFKAPLYTIASFKSWGLSQYSQLSIYAPNLIWVYELNAIFLTFWCGGKIFMTQVGGIGNQAGTTLAPITLVAGNHNLSDPSNSANASFNILESRGYLINNHENSGEQDVPRHRCGMLFQNGLHVYYLDSNNHLNVRAIQGQYVGKASTLD